MTRDAHLHDPGQRSDDSDRRPAAHDRRRRRRRLRRPRRPERLLSCRSRTRITAPTLRPRTGIFVAAGGANSRRRRSVVRVTRHRGRALPDGTLRREQQQRGSPSVTGIVACGERQPRADDDGRAMPAPSPTNLPRPTSARGDARSASAVARHLRVLQLRAASARWCSRFRSPARRGPSRGTAIDEPGRTGAAARTLANSLRRITLDDGLGIQNPDFTSGTRTATRFSLDEQVPRRRHRGGHGRRARVRLQPLPHPADRRQPSTRRSTRGRTTEDVGGSVHVAAMNTLNFFLTLDTTATRNRCPGRPVRRHREPRVPRRGRRPAAGVHAPADKLLAALSGLESGRHRLQRAREHAGVDPLE